MCGISGIISLDGNKINNLEKRIRLHNEGKGAKFTKGKKWKITFLLKTATTM